MSFFTHDRRVTLLTLTTALPAIALSVALLWIGDYSTLVRVTALVLITHYFGEAAAQGFLHTTTGIALFAVALVLTIGLDVALRAIIRRRDMRKRRSPT